jgi:hypothetical protein
MPLIVYDEDDFLTGTITARHIELVEMGNYMLNSPNHRVIERL